MIDACNLLLLPCHSHPLAHMLLQVLADIWAESARDYVQDAGFAGLGWGPEKAIAEEQIKTAAARHLPRMEKALGGKPYTVLADKPCWADFQASLSDGCNVRGKKERQQLWLLAPCDCSGGAARLILCDDPFSSLIG
jgi:hypothetical protein